MSNNGKYGAYGARGAAGDIQDSLRSYKLSVAEAGRKAMALRSSESVRTGDNSAAEAHKEMSRIVNDAFAKLIAGNEIQWVQHTLQWCIDNYILKAAYEVASILTEALPAPYRSKHVLETVGYACANQICIVALATIEDFTRNMNSHTQEASFPEYLQKTVLDWADWHMSATTDAWGMLLTDASPTDHAKIAGVGAEVFQNLTEAWLGVRDQVSQHYMQRMNEDRDNVDMRATFMFTATHACLGSLVAIIAGLDNPEVFPYPHRMYAKVSYAMLKPVDTRNLPGAVWNLPPEQLLSPKRPR